MRPRRFRRRFLLGAAALLALLVGVVLTVGLLTRGWDGPGGEPGGDPGPPPGDHPSRDDRGPGGLVLLVGGVVAVGAAATALAYRRISRPVGDLLGAAERVAEGDYDVAVVPDGPHELRMLTATFNDMARRLAVTDEQRRRFLADVTHELRTPLSVLQTGIEAQLDGIHPRDDRHLASLLDETQRLGRLVDDLHTLALAEAGRIVLHREPVAPAALVEDAVEAHAALAGDEGVVVRAEVVGEPPEVDVDPARVRQVLDNLLSNAVRHTPAGREVVVRVEAADRPPGPPGAGAGAETGTGMGMGMGAETGAGAGVCITVTDAGPGFRPDELAHVFERFTRAADSGGSGLGLAIARDLVQAHGGEIRAGNDPTTGGATVRFTL